MKALVKVSRDPAIASAHRGALMARPREFFREFFNGRTPTEEEKVAWIEAAILHMTSLEFYENDLYSVLLAHAHPFIRLTISRLDGQPFKTWKHLQEIKNQLTSPDHEAVELFPAESRSLDAVNEYHLWVHSDPRFRFPFGFQTARVVLQEPVKALQEGTTFTRDVAPVLETWDAQATRN